VIVHEAADLVRKTILDVPDFPKKDIVFKDLTPVFQEPKVMKAMISAFADRYREAGIQQVVAIESRGFLIGAPLAQELDVGLSLVRKKGKLPRKTVARSYALEYGSGILELHEDAIEEGQKVVLVDDLLATGGTAAAAKSLIEEVGGEVHESAFIVELGFLNWREKLSGEVFSLVRYT